MSARNDTVVKFPIGRVVREHRIAPLLAATPEAEAIDQAFRSVEHAMKSLERQRSKTDSGSSRMLSRSQPPLCRIVPAARRGLRVPHRVPQRLAAASILR